MSDLELTMMRRVGELKTEVERLKKFNDEALAHIAKEERKSRDRLDMAEAENARLKAEVERLTALVESNLNQSKLAMAKSDAFVRTLEAQVERLTKAGDELWEFAKLADTNAHKARRKALKDWLAAKEGKPSA